MLITRAHGSWVVLGTLVTDVEVEAGTPAPPGCGSCTLCIDACPTGALDEPGVLDATRCLSYWTQTAAEMPDDVMDALEDRVYGCDICQDVCPWNRGVERRRADERLPADALPVVRLADWLGEDDAALAASVERLFVPRNDGRWLRRNALVALGNVGGPTDVRLAVRHAESDDHVLSAVARRALDRLGRLGRGGT
jgi:epoxyqueuosine reductase